MVQSSISRSRKRRKGYGEGIEHHVFLLPKRLEEQAPPMPVPQHSMIANPLANPIVQAVDTAHHLFHSSVDTRRPNHCKDDPPTTLSVPKSPSHPHPSCIPLIQQNILLSPVSSKKRSPFWQAFHQFNTKHPQNYNEDRQHHAACNLCGRTVNMGRDNSTTTLSQHLRKCDRDLWTRLKTTIVEPTTTTTTATTTTKETTESLADASTKTTKPSSDALKQYIQVAFSVRFKDPPEEEWAGLIMILHKELNRKLTKETIRGIFQTLSSSFSPSSCGETKCSPGSRRFHLKTSDGTSTSSSRSATPEMDDAAVPDPCGAYATAH